MNNLDWSNSVVAQTMMRGYPIFGEHGLNISSGSGSPTNFSAYLDLEPTFEIDVENFIAYLESEESRLMPSYTIQDLYSKGSTSGTFSNYIPAGVEIGLAHLTVYNSHARSPEKASFDLLYGEDSPGTSSTYKRDALRFVGGNDANNYSFLLVETTGPAFLRHQCDRPLQTETIIRFTQAYLDAIDELPSDFDYQAYLSFGTRFGRGYVRSLYFSHTEIRIASKVYVTLGSKNYTETNCQDPPFNMLTYGVFRDHRQGCFDALTDDQRSKLETFENNLFGMIRNNTKAPTTSPTRTPTVPSSSPTSSPTSVPVSLGTSAAATSTCFTSKLPVALALALFSFLPQ